MLVEQNIETSEYIGRRFSYLSWHSSTFGQLNGPCWGTPGKPLALSSSHAKGGSVAEWLAYWTQVQKGPGSNRSRDAVG